MFFPRNDDTDVCVRTLPARFVPGDFAYMHGMVLEHPKHIGCNTVAIEFESGRELFPADYRHLYRLEADPVGQEVRR